MEYKDLPKYNTPKWLSLNDFEGEEWREIEGFEGLYSISNYGRVKSHPRLAKTGRGGVYYTKERILKYKKSRGYDCVTMRKNCSVKYLRVARLVGMAFIPNDNNLPQINHKDCQPHNNCVYNLEWCDAKYNCNYGDHKLKQSIAQKLLYKREPWRRELRSMQQKEIANRQEYKEHQRMVQRHNSNCIPIIKYSLDGVFICEYISAKEAERQTGIKAQNIGFVINHPEIQKQAGGFIWKRKL